MVSLSESRFWQPVPSVLMLKTLPSELTPPSEVIPYRVDPLSVKLPQGFEPPAPVPGMGKEYRLVSPLPLVLIEKTLPARLSPPWVIPYRIEPLSVKSPAGPRHMASAGSLTSNVIRFVNVAVWSPARLESSASSTRTPTRVGKLILRHIFSPFPRRSQKKSKVTVAHRRRRLAVFVLRRRICIFVVLGR